MSASLLVDSAELDAERLVVEGDDHRHLFRARRLGSGAAIRVTDGAGRHRSGSVLTVDRRQAEVELGNWLPVEEPSSSVTMFVATPRPERARWMVEKLVELGVRRICFVHAERVNHEVGRQLGRLERVAKSALLQCGSVWLPILEERAWSEVASAPGATTSHSFLLDPEAEANMSGACQKVPAGASVEVWVGPEGGFTDDEEGDLIRRGVRSVHLGPLILRVETAATVAAGFLLAR